MTRLFLLLVIFVPRLAAARSSTSRASSPNHPTRTASPGDLRLLGELSVTSKLTTHIALTDGLTVAYDRTPPDGIKRYDLALKIGLW